MIYYGLWEDSNKDENNPPQIKPAEKNDLVEVRREEIRRAYAGENLSLFSKIKMSFTSPGKLFQAVAADKDYREAFIFFLVTTLIATIIGVVLIFAKPMPLMVVLGSYGSMFAGMSIAMAFVGWLVMLGVFFIVVVIFHLFVMMLGGKNGLVNTYKSLAYAGAPATLLGWISTVAGFFNSTASTIITVVLYIWFLVLGMKALSVMQAMSKIRALLIPVIIALLIVVAFLGFTYMAFSGIAGSAMNNPYGNFSYPTGFDNQDANQLLDQIVQNQMNTQTTKVRIDSLSDNIIMVRNIGSEPVLPQSMAVFVNGAIVDCSWSNPGDITTDTSGTCTTPFSCNGNTRIRILSATGFDEKIC